MEHRNIGFTMLRTPMTLVHNLVHDSVDCHKTHHDCTESFEHLIIISVETAAQFEL